MKWEQYNGTLNVGDIVEMSSKIPSTNPILGNIVVVFVKHYGIVFNDNGILKIVHNPFGGSPEIRTIAEMFDTRRPERIYKSGVTNEQIIERYNNCKQNNYKFWTFNCEDFVSEICDCNIGRDQRVYYFGVAGTIITLAVIGTITYLLVKIKK